MITPTQNKYISNNYNNTVYANRRQCCPAFKSNILLKTVKSSENGSRNLEFVGRKVINFITSFVGKKKVNDIYNELSKVEKTSPEYMDKISQVGRVFAKGKEVEINLESNRIKDIVDSNEPHIFIMNHDNQTHDPEMMTMFNTFLSEEYIKSGKAATCPRPVVILNEDILLSMNKKRREIFEKLGAVGIDARLYSADGKKNAKKLIPVLRDFANGKANIYIFPEGKMSAYKGLDLKDKFQTGVADMVHLLINKRDDVRIVPLAFDYNKKAKPILSSIYIGSPVVFKKEGNHVLSGRGNVSSSFTSDDYKNFFNNPDIDYETIADKGVPVEGKNTVAYIGGVLCENLRICKEEARAVLPKKTLGDKVIDC